MTVKHDGFGYQALTIPRGAFDPLAMSTGEPSPPRRVIWSNREYRVTSVQRTGESTARDRGGSSERYRDRHYFMLTLEGGLRLEAYFERRARDPRRRWWARVIEDTTD